MGICGRYDACRIQLRSVINLTETTMERGRLDPKHLDQIPKVSKIGTKIITDYNFFVSSSYMSL